MSAAWHIVFPLALGFGGLEIAVRERDLAFLQDILQAAGLGR